MKKKKLIPGWLLVLDLIMVLCCIVTYWVSNQPKGAHEMLLIITWLPVTIAGLGWIPLLFLNILVILIRFFQNRAIVKSNKFYTGEKKPKVVAVPAPHIGTAPVPQAPAASSNNEGHMELF